LGASCEQSAEWGLFAASSGKRQEAASECRRRNGNNRIEPKGKVALLVVAAMFRWKTIPILMGEHLAAAEEEEEEEEEHLLPLANAHWLPAVHFLSSLLATARAWQNAWRNARRSKRAQN